MVLRCAVSGFGIDIFSNHNLMADGRTWPSQNFHDLGRRLFNLVEVGKLARFTQARFRKMLATGSRQEIYSGSTWITKMFTAFTLTDETFSLLFFLLMNLKLPVSSLLLTFIVCTTKHTPASSDVDYCINRASHFTSA